MANNNPPVIDYLVDEKRLRANAKERARRALIREKINARERVNARRRYAANHEKELAKDRKYRDWQVKPGSVYFIQAALNNRGPVKIGKFKGDIKVRLMHLQCGNPLKLVLLGSFNCDDVFKEECILHRKFAAQRLEGEWFTWSEELQGVINERV